jgi:NADPH:quinone reductase-like Zn-dependent oxidoreductase
MAEQMEAVVFRRPGGPEVLHVERLERPEPQVGEVLVRVHAASVNPADDKARGSPVLGRVLRGLGRGAVVPGLDFAGVVVGTGPGATRFLRGDEVYGVLGVTALGSYAEYVRVKERQVARKPDNLSFEEAAAVPVVGLTALHLLRDKAGVHAGERVLVNGASGGVGTMAVQLARAFGCHVTGVCGTSNLELVRSLGAERVVDYREEDVRQAGQFDVVLDAVAKMPLETVRAVLAPNGRFVSTLPSPAAFVQMVTGPLRKQHAHIYRLSPSGTDLEELRRMIEEGRVRPVIERVLPFTEAARAHQHVHEGHARGKVVLAMVH